jgi:hypothetical protein
MLKRLPCLAIALVGMSSALNAADAVPEKPAAQAAELQNYLDAETKDLRTGFEQLKPQLGPPPEGFEWSLYRDVMFLKPLEWNELTRGDYLNSAYGASPEAFTATKNFEMGFTIQIFKGTDAMHGIKAKAAALAYLKPFVDAHKPEEILKAKTQTAGTTDMIILRYQDAPSGETPIIVHKFVVSDDTLDIVHAYTFESPASSWDKNWDSFGTPIISHLRTMGTAPMKKM